MFGVLVVCYMKSGVWDISHLKIFLLKMYVRRLTIAKTFNYHLLMISYSCSLKSKVAIDFHHHQDVPSYSIS